MSLWGLSLTLRIPHFQMQFLFPLTPFLNIFLPHTGHSSGQSLNACRSSFLSRCRRDFLQEVSPEDCSYKLEYSHDENVELIIGVRLWCCVYCQTFAAFGVVAEPEMSVSAAVTALSLHVGFTAALTGNQTSAHVCHSVTDSPVQRAGWVTVTGCRRNISTMRSRFGLDSSGLADEGLGSTLSGLTLADVGVSDVPLRMLEVKRPALIAVVSSRVVKTAVANPSADVSRGHVRGHVKVARVRVLVAVTPCRKPSRRSHQCHSSLRRHPLSSSVDSLLQALVLRPSAGLQGRSWWKSPHCSQFRPFVLWLHMQCP